MLREQRGGAPSLGGGVRPGRIRAEMSLSLGVEAQVCTHQPGSEGGGAPGNVEGTASESAWRKRGHPGDMQGLVWLAGVGSEGDGR